MYAVFWGNIWEAEFSSLQEAISYAEDAAEYRGRQLDIQWVGNSHGGEDV